MPSWFMPMPSDTEIGGEFARRAAGRLDAPFAASTWKSWVMLQGVCSPFMLTTPIIGLAIAASSSPIARMKARCGARSRPSVVTRDRNFFMRASLSASSGMPDARWTSPVAYSSGATMVGCLNCAASSFGSIPVSA